MSQLSEKRILSDSKTHLQQLVNASNGQIFSESILKFQVLSLAARMTTQDYKASSKTLLSITSLIWSFLHAVQ